VVTSRSHAYKRGLGATDNYGWDGFFNLSFYHYDQAYFTPITISPSYDIATRVQAFTFKVYGVTNTEIERMTGIKKRQIRNIYVAYVRAYRDTQ